MCYVYVWLITDSFCFLSHYYISYESLLMGISLRWGSIFATIFYRVTQACRDSVRQTSAGDVYRPLLALQMSSYNYSNSCLPELNKHWSVSALHRHPMLPLTAHYMRICKYASKCPLNLIFQGDVSRVISIWKNANSHWRADKLPGLGLVALSSVSYMRNVAVALVGFGSVGQNRESGFISTCTAKLFCWEHCIS